MSKVLITIIVAGAVVGGCMMLRTIIPPPPPPVIVDKMSFQQWADTLADGNIVQLANDLLKAGDISESFADEDAVLRSPDIASIQAEKMSRVVTPSFFLFLPERSDQIKLMELMESHALRKRSDFISYKATLAEVAEEIRGFSRLAKETPRRNLVYDDLIETVGRYNKDFSECQTSQSGADTPFLLPRDFKNAKLIIRFVNDFRSFAEESREFKGRFDGIHTDDDLKEIETIVGTKVFFDATMLSPIDEKQRSAMNALKKLLPQQD